MTPTDRDQYEYDDQMTDGWLRSIGGVEPDYTEDFTETTFIFDLDNDHCLNVEVDNQRVYIYDAGQEHVAIELPHIKTCGQFLKLLSTFNATGGEGS